MRLMWRGVVATTSSPRARCRVQVEALYSYELQNYCNQQEITVKFNITAASYTHSVYATSHSIITNTMVVVVFITLYDIC